MTEIKKDQKKIKNKIIKKENKKLRENKK